MTKTNPTNSNANQLNHPLSAAGQKRRSQMLLDLKLEMANRVRTRKLIRRASAIGLALAVASSLFAWQGNPDADRVADVTGKDSEETLVEKGVMPPALSGTMVPTFRYVSVDRNRKDVVSEYVVRKNESEPSYSFFSTIDDGQLVSLLEEMGKPSVVGRIDGKYRVVGLEQKRRKVHPKEL